VKPLFVRQIQRESAFVALDLGLVELQNIWWFESTIQACINLAKIQPARKQELGTKEISSIRARTVIVVKSAHRIKRLPSPGDLGAIITRTAATTPGV